MILGILHDTGYKPFLSELAADRSIEQRITLLQGGCNRTDLHSLGFSRPLLKWKNVFAERGSLAKATIPDNTKTETIATPMNTEKSLSWKSTKTNGPLVTQPKIALKVMANSSAPRKAKKPPKTVPGPLINPQPRPDRLTYQRDTRGNRIDRPLNINPVSAEVENLRAKKLCGLYYLVGHCNGCKRNHHLPPLNEKDFNILWHTYRQKTCKRFKKGHKCEDRSCMRGHKRG